MRVPYVPPIYGRIVKLDITLPREGKDVGANPTVATSNKRNS